MGEWLDGKESSGCEGQGFLECLSLDRGALSEPGGIETMVGTTGSTFMVDILGNGIEQSPGRAIG